MKYLVIIIILLVGSSCGNFLYYKTNLCDFLIDKLKINTKFKCVFIDFIVLFLGMNAISNILINYKNIFSDVLLFTAALITGLSEYIRREVKQYNKK